MLTCTKLNGLAMALVALLATTMPVFAADCDDDAFDPTAMKSIEHLNDYLARTKEFRVAIDVAYDIVQDSGQKLEFGDTRVISVRRPAQMRVEDTDRDGSKTGIIFSGKEIVAYDIDAKVYARAPQPGDLDAALGHFVNDLGMHLAMEPILRGRLAKDAKTWAHSVDYVDEETIAGVACDHVAMRGDWEDVELWIARGNRPLLQRIAITYVRADGKPKFSAQLRDWDLDPSLSDKSFAFTPQAGAANIPFQPARMIDGVVPQGAGNRP
jgi:hypothetical protein